VQFQLGETGVDFQSVPNSKHGTNVDVRTSDFIFSTFTQNGHQISVCVGTDCMSAPAVKNLSFEEFAKMIEKL
jgi:hypothetical protein